MIKNSVFAYKRKENHADIQIFVNKYSQNYLAE